MCRRPTVHEHSITPRFICFASFRSLPHTRSLAHSSSWQTCTKWTWKPTRAVNQVSPSLVLRNETGFLSTTTKQAFCKIIQWSYVRQHSVPYYLFTLSFQFYFYLDVKGKENCWHFHHLYVTWLPSLNSETTEKKILQVVIVTLNANKKYNILMQESESINNYTNTTIFPSI